MKKYHFKSIRGKLTFWFLMLSILPLVTSLTITYFNRVNAIEAAAAAKLTAIRDLKVQQVKNWVDERRGDINVMAGDFEIRELENIFNQEIRSTEDKVKVQSAQELFNRNLSNYSDYKEIFFIEASSGIVKISTDQKQEGTNKKSDSYFKIPLETGRVFIKDIYFSSTTGNYEMTFSAPVYCMTHNEHIVGVLVARVDLNNSLFKLLNNRTGLGETGETLIINSDGFALNELRWYTDAPLNLKIAAFPALKASKGYTGVTKSNDYRGVQVLAAYTYIGETGWGFVAKQDISEIYIPIKAMMQHFFIIFIVWLIIISVLGFLLSRSFSSPIIKLNKVAETISRGDYSARSQVTSHDELGTLSKSFNTMASITESRIKVQQGVLSISETMIGRNTMKEFSQSMLRRFMKLTDANMSTFFILNEMTIQFEHFASIGANEQMLTPYQAEHPQGELGSVFSTKKIFYLKNIPEDTVFKYKTIAGEANPKEIVAIPIVVEGSIIAVVSLINLQQFEETSLEILEQAWPNINTAYSNLITSERTRILAEHLSKINQQIEAQSEELQEQSEELQEQSEELQNQSEELQKTSFELQKQNKELVLQKKQVEVANKLKSEFLSNMSHELRTPLNSIMALSSVLQMQAKEKLNDEENNYLEIVERNGKRLLTLINDILDLSKIEAGKMEVFPALFSLNSFLQIVKENVQSLAEEKGLELNLVLPTAPIKVESDESRLHQVVLNIVSNAVKFTPKGSVTISVDQDAENVFVTVEDTGIGISEEMLPFVFDEFRQADGTSTRQYEGTGLGLAIARKMMKMLGGDIQVESVLHQGSKFKVQIPIKWYDTESPQTSYEFQNPSSQLAADVNQNKGKRILLVEDKIEAVIQVKMVLEKESYTIEVANGGKEALEFVKHTIPDGIILDLMMPEIDGFEVLDKIRSVAETRNIPILILTAKDLTQSDLEKLNAGQIQQLIHKGDIDIKGLLNKVNLMISANAEISVSKVKEDQTKNKSDTKTAISILVIEDNLDNLVTIRAILKEVYPISEALDGETAFQKALDESPDLILMDMSLPKISGMELVQRLKTNEMTKKIPIIAVTAQAMKGDKERFLALGCSGYVSKPIDNQELLKEIRKFG